MKITEYGAIRSANDLKRLRRAGASGDSSFATMLEAASGTPAETAPAGDLAPTSPLDNMLAIQEISEEEAQRRKLMQRGKTILDSLEKLRQQLLAGTISPDLLKDLNHQLSLQKQHINDPHLLALIEDIELRAAVELAKLQMAPREG